MTVKETRVFGSRHRSFKLEYTQGFRTHPCEDEAGYIDPCELQEGLPTATRSDENQPNCQPSIVLKRKAKSPCREIDSSMLSPAESPIEELVRLADQIVERLRREVVADDTLPLCGPAALQILADRPDEAVALAHQKLLAWPYRNVPVCWRRLYEEASLYKAVKLLRSHVKAPDAPGGFAKRTKLHVATDPIYAINASARFDEWLNEIIRALDTGMALSGAPGRRELYENIFLHLNSYLNDAVPEGLPERFVTTVPEPLQTNHPIASTTAPTFQAFQRHLDSKATPLLMTGALEHWPARQTWGSPAHLLRLTLGGRRLVPVEIGKSYTDEAWGQRIMPFAEYMNQYLLPDEAEDIGYLAQHDLFAQIPALRDEITIPDYCFTTPPASEVPASRAGLPAVEQLEEPLLNAWLGPKGTTSPLHTDPYHNILCQLVGYKYVRLYAPEETPKLYPRGVDEAGVNMENTSNVDIAELRAFERREPGKVLGYPADTESVVAKYPLAVSANYQEALLGPGECLYVPVGWWHHIESLSISFSVSFWWN